MPSPVSRRLLRRGLVAAAVVLAALGGAAAFVLLHAPGNVSHPNVQFTQPTTTTAPPPAHRRRRRARVAVDNFLWPWYGFDAGRTRLFAGPSKLHPPMHVGWRFDDGALLEFPPVIYKETLYLIDDDGDAKALNLLNGHERWHHKIATLAAASPAVAAKAGVVLIPVLSVQGHSPGGGQIVALSMRTGRIVWSRPIAAGSESSPIVHRKTVYFGDQGGILRAMNVSNGHQYWTYHASGAIKGGPALVGGVLYFGDYSGHVYAINAHTGRQVWVVGTNGAHFGFGSGQFYSSPAVAYGRVYMGNTDGRVYSFGARNGALAWATSTGAYVYGSAAVADPPGLGPTVYVGSYDGNMYAFNAQSGSIRWRHAAGGKISGSATVVGKVVYYSDLGSKSTAGLNAVTGQQVFSFPDGAFNPVIADYKAIYLDGYSQVYQLLPGRHRAAKATAHHRKRKAARRKRRGAATRHRRAKAAARRHQRNQAAARRHQAAARKAAARRAHRRKQAQSRK
ncbi:MAG TPA: PQQ-binding-like beta-propeller repeat protein [Solirubrobacteraceae bacterium]|jgi:outer membrane protein assembly factor BamB